MAGLLVDGELREQLLESGVHTAEDELLVVPVVLERFGDAVADLVDVVPAHNLGHQV